MEPRLRDFVGAGLLALVLLGLVGLIFFATLQSGLGSTVQEPIAAVAGLDGLAGVAGSPGVAGQS
jgi:hypothetical protein